MPVCFVVDEAPSIRSFLSLVLHGVGIETEELTDLASFRHALERRAPDLVFLDVGLESAEAIESVADLGQRGYRGHVQLMSTRGAAVMEHVRSIGQQHGVEMLPVLKKPFDANAIVAIMQTLNLGHAAPRAARVELSEVLANGWIEFWYQPKIDLRRKQLVGVEAFARCRHPRARRPAPGRLHAGGERGRPDDAVGACAGERALGQRTAVAARDQFAVRRQYPGQRAGEALDPRSGAEASRASSTSGRA